MSRMKFRVAAMTAIAALTMITSAVDTAEAGHYRHGRRRCCQAAYSYGSCGGQTWVTPVVATGCNACGGAAACQNCEGGAAPPPGGAPGEAGPGAPQDTAPPAPANGEPYSPAPTPAEGAAPPAPNAGGGQQGNQPQGGQPGGANDNAPPPQQPQPDNQGQ